MFMSIRFYKTLLICKWKQNKSITSLFSTSTSSSKNNRNTNYSRKNKSYEMFIKGVPFVIFIVAGSYFLSIFMSTHMEIKDKNNNSKSTRKFDLEEEHRLLMEKLNINEFKLSRIPRPDADGNNTNNSTITNSNNNKIATKK